MIAANFNQEMSESPMIEVPIPFSGFYETIHGYQIEGVIELDLESITSEEMGLDADDKLFLKWVEDGNISYEPIFWEYAKKYTKKIAEEFEIEGLLFSELDSPREYNFLTDQIIAKMPTKEFEKIRKVVETEGAIIYAQYIKETYSSRPGFMSFYSPDINHPDWTREILEVAQRGSILDVYVKLVDESFSLEDFYLEDLDFVINLVYLQFEEDMKTNKE